MVTFAYAEAQLILPNPKPGNREVIDLQAIYKRMMDGTIYGYRMGSGISSFELDFGNLNRPKILEAIAFLKASAGQQIVYQDHRGATWSGKILNFPFEATHAAIRDNRFRLTFEGTQNA